MILTHCVCIALATKSSFICVRAVRKQCILRFFIDKLLGNTFLTRILYLLQAFAWCSQEDSSPVPRSMLGASEESELIKVGTWDKLRPS